MIYIVLILNHETHKILWCFKTHLIYEKRRKKNPNFFKNLISIPNDVFNLYSLNDDNQKKKKKKQQEKKRITKVLLYYILCV